jgi:hypothetical protein
VSAVDPEAEFTKNQNPAPEPLFSKDFSSLELTLEKISPHVNSQQQKVLDFRQN